MNFNWNNVKTACCAKWLVLPTVYSDTLSYGEQLDKFCYQLNQLIENNNILPDFIAEMIKEYINSGAIGEVVRDILADYILNVKYPPEGITPAIGDGSADDTEAIQGCIDYASANGGVVYFPYGSYLTQPLTMKDGVSLFGFDRYSTKIVLKGGATKPLIGGTVADFSIANLTLDGNSGIQVNDVNVVTIMATNVLFTNLIIKDGYTLVNYVGTGGHFQIDNVVFGNAVEKCLLTTGNADVQCENVVFNQLSAVGGISVVDIGTDGGYFNIKSLATCNKCIVVSGNENNIVAIVKNATTPVTDTGLKNNIEIVGMSDKQYFDGDTTKEVNGTYSKHVGGTYTKAVDGNGSESYDGNYSKIVTGVTSETYNGDKTVTEENETVDAKRVTKNVTDYSVTAENSVTLRGNDVKLYPTNPLTYRKVVSAMPFDYVEMKDTDNKIYKLLASYGNFELLPILDVTKYGVLPNGEDMTEKLNALIDQYADTYTIYLKRGTYTFNGTININKAETHFICDGRIVSSADVAILLLAVDCVIEVFQLYGNGSGVGFQNGETNMQTTYGNNRLKFDFIYGFDTAIKFYANGNHGVQNNITTLDRIGVCNTGILFECGDNSTPWINQNTFHGGWITAGSSLPNAVGIKFVKGANMVDRFNGNVFNDFSCENTRYPIDIVYAWHNVFNNFRLLENVGTDLIKCGSDTEDNRFIGSSNYVNYKNITDNGIFNHYWLTFHDDEDINICNEAVFKGGGFIPLAEYFKTKLFSLDRGTSIPLDGWVDYLYFDGSMYNVEAILPLKYSYSTTANSFILETGPLEGFAHVTLYGGQIIAKSEDATGTSGVQLKANMKYLFVPVNDLTYKVIPLTISSITNNASGYINDNHVNGTATVSGDSATLNSDCMVKDGICTIAVNSTINY